jgi:hypothetical protein
LYHLSVYCLSEDEKSLKLIFSQFFSITLTGEFLVSIHQYFFRFSKISVASLKFHLTTTAPHDGSGFSHFLRVSVFFLAIHLISEAVVAFLNLSIIHHPTKGILIKPALLDFHHESEPANIVSKFIFLPS